MRSQHLVRRDLLTDAAGLPALTGLSSDLVDELTIEAALFPMLFPFGHGSYSGAGTLAQYLRYRLSCLFSPFTLFKPYLLLMYQVRQAVLLSNATKSVFLERELLQYRKARPDCSDQDTFKHVAQHVVPPSVSGSPGYYKKNLKELLALVEAFGLPFLFLTLTSDEVSSTRWAEIDDLEAMLHRFNSSMSCYC